MEEPRFLHEPETEPIPGYRLIQPLGRGGFGEVWKCEAPGGLLKAIKFVHGGHHILDDNAPADEELRAIQHVKAIRHPFILSMERVEIVDGELAIVMELADKSLHDVLEAQRAAGQKGIERPPLLAYLREAAEVLDVMHARHGLQHLDIKPRNLFLVSNHVKVGDFGLVSTMRASSGKTSSSGLGAITPVYAAPEVFEGTISAHCDQYSLAILYQELLTGTLPFNGKNSRQLLMQHLLTQPDLSALSESDRVIVARALSKNPIDRFTSCSDFVQALVYGHTEVVTTTTVFLKDTPPTSSSIAETRQQPAVKTIATRRPVCVRPRTSGLGENISVEVRDLVSRTPLTEVWNGQSSDGQPMIVKVLFGCPGPTEERIAQLATIRHPRILPIHIIQHMPGRLVLAMPAGEHTLRDLLGDYRAQGEAGIPRVRLLKLLQQAAETLETLQQDTGVQHLGLNPRTLFVQGEHLLLSDFGVIPLVWGSARQPIAPLNGRYSAPELHKGQISSACDQYSLALIYAEMLTGTPATVSVSGNAKVTHPAALNLPETDRAIILRALDADPGKRFESSLDLIAALRAVSSEPATPLPPVSPSHMLPHVPTRPQRTESEPVGEVMQTHFGTLMPATLIRLRIEEFRQHWQAETLSANNSDYIFEMDTPQSLSQRWTGTRPQLEIRLHIAAPDIEAPAGVQVRTEVRMHLVSRDCSSEQSAELLKTVGPQLVESMRTHLLVTPRKRMAERVTWPHPLQVSSILPDGSLGPPIECQGKDISLTGIAFYLPGQVPSQQVMLHLPETEQTKKMSMPATIVRALGCGDGWYELGAMFLPPDELPPDDEPLDAESKAA